MQCAYYDLRWTASSEDFWPPELLAGRESIVYRNGDEVASIRRSCALPLDFCRGRSHLAGSKRKRKPKRKTNRKRKSCKVRQKPGKNGMAKISQATHTHAHTHTPIHFSNKNKVGKQASGLKACGVILAELSGTREYFKNDWHVTHSCTFKLHHSLLSVHSHAHDSRSSGLTTNCTNFPASSA